MAAGRRCASADRIEAEGDGFQQRVADGYRELARRFPDRVRLVPGEGSVEEVHARRDGRRRGARVIDVPGQPLAQRILRAALARETPPQQLLLYGPAGTGKRAAARETAWSLMDPDGAHRHTAEALDLTEVEAVGQQILLRDLEEALTQIASRPSVMRRRVMIVQGAERLREQEGAPRLLKTLEEPAPHSHILLVTDHPADLLPTIRSRCLPVPFRPAPWRAAVAAGGPFEAEMRTIGADFGLAALAGAGSPAVTGQGDPGADGRGRGLEHLA